MTPSSLADLLPDFARQPTADGRAEAAAPRFEMAGPAGAPRAEEPAPDDNALMRRVAEAEAALRATLGAEHEAELEALRQRHAEEIAALQEKLGGQAGEAIAARFTQMEGHIGDLATSVTARILSVTLSEDLQRRAVEELARVVAGAMGDREAVKVRVSGAPLLFEALQAAMGEKAEHLQFFEASGFDLTVAIDESLFETRLSEWSDALGEVLS